MKILWALEPFHQNASRIGAMYNFLKLFVTSTTNIEVGFVVTRSEPELYLAYDIPDKNRYTVLPRRLMKEKLGQAKVSINDKKIHIIDFDTLSTTAAVDRCLALATSLGSDLIALHTHARKGYKRFFLGSFAETAIHRSRIDLLLINPVAKFPASLASILFACDFGPESKKYLQRTIEICVRAKAKLTVFHVAEVMYRWSLDESNPKIHAYRKHIKRMCEWIEDECKKSRVACQVSVTTEIKPVADLVLNASNKVHADLIIVMAKTGRIAALMGGSTTRELVRSSTKPVLVLK